MTMYVLNVFLHDCATPVTLSFTDRKAAVASMEIAIDQDGGKIELPDQHGHLLVTYRERISHCILADLDKDLAYQSVVAGMQAAAQQDHAIRMQRRAQLSGSTGLSPMMS